MKTLIFFSFFFTLVLLMKMGHSLNCYKCNACESTSPNRETCKTVDNQLETAGCLTQKVRVARSIEPMVIKKCVYFEKNKQYQCPNLPDSDPYTCHVCQNGDYCNSANSFRTVNYATVFAALFFSGACSLF